MPQEWSAPAVAELLARLARHAGHVHRGKPSESALGSRFGYRQQTVNSWKNAKREPATFREFLRAYAKAFTLDEYALLQEWEIRPASARPSAGARAEPPPVPALGQLEAFAARMALNPQLAEIRKRAPGFWEQEWLPVEKAVIERAKKDIDAVTRRAQEELDQRMESVLKLWRAERGRSRSR